MFDPSQSSNLIKKIRSNFIRNILFSFINEKIKFQIIRYNKSIQSKMDIDINTYKKLYEIEIIIIPAREKFGKFINIIEEEKKYYHVFFNDNKEEEKIKKQKEQSKIIKLKK